jgi:hypothetical protein
VLDARRFVARSPRFPRSHCQAVTINNLQAHEVNIRLMGDFAIIHARTTFTAHVTRR